MGRGSVVALLLLGLAVAACPPARDAGDDEAGSERQTFAQSSCGLCLPDACAHDFDRCAADPACAGHLDCLFACPLDVGGAIDPACEQACAEPAGTTSLERAQALESCRARMDCLTCEPVPSDSGHPIFDQICEPSADPDACAQCEDEVCCETPCDADCLALNSCLESCDPEPFACDEACFAAHPQGVKASAAWFTCMSVGCRDRCERFRPVHPCVECSMANCAVEFAGCYADAECFQNFLCGAKCDTAACRTACDQKYPGAVDRHAIFIGCVLDHCVELCSD